MAKRENKSDSEANIGLKKSVRDGSRDRQIQTLSYLYNKELVELDSSKEAIDSYLIQTQKILKATEIKNKYREQLTSWINEFQLFLNSLPIHNGIKISSFSRKVFKRPSRDLRFVKNIANHSKNNLCCDKDITITFIRPECVGTFGLFKINSLPGPNIEMNLHVTIPKTCFHITDSLNNRYFIKKFFYLMYLAEHLRSQNICSRVKCAYYNENVLLPYLILCPNSTEKIAVKIFLIPEQHYFKPTKYSPEVNNIKGQVFKEDLGRIDNIGELPTTFYNAALGFDASLAENNIFIEQLFSSSRNFQEGLKLIVIWMNQRKLNNGLGAFTTDLAIYFMVYLISRRKINKSMSTYHVFRTFLYFMHTIDLTHVPISICEEISEEEIQKYKLYFDIVLMDKTGSYNTAAFLNINAYLRVKHECELALGILDQSPYSFSDLFSTNIPLYLQYDAIIDVKNENNYELLLKSVKRKERAKYVSNHMLLVMRILQKYLNIGFNKRVKNIIPIATNNTEWEYGVRHKISNCRLLFAIQLNPDFAFNILEFGPVLNEAEEKYFKEFWDDPTCLTWFHDNSARLVSQFNTDTIKCRRDIIRTITKYVMTEKLNLNYKLYYNELEDFLVNEKMSTWYSCGTNEERSRRISECSDALGQKIKSLDIQPQIVGIEGVSDVFCYTNVFPPFISTCRCEKWITTFKKNNMVLNDKTFIATPKYVEPIECVIQLAYRSGLPEDLNILQQIKITILVKISELLRKEYKIISSVKPPHLDVLYKGIVFRYNIFWFKEIALLRKKMDICGLKTDNEMSYELEKKHIVIPKIVAALKEINKQNPSYGVSTCLAKRWIRAQLIDDFLLPDMVINLLNAHQYLYKSLYNYAIAPQQAFLRFLKFIVEVRWDQKPVVINLENKLTDEEISKLETAMRNNRNKFPALHIFTPYDDGNSVFTRTAPCKEVLIRLKVLATEFLNYVKNIILDESLYSWKELFIPNRRGFNCILNLKHVSNPRIHEQITRIHTESSLTSIEPNEQNRYMPVINFNPVKIYLRELRTNYGEFCVFFHDTYGGNYIGVLWKPGLLLESKEDIRRGFEIFGKNVLSSIDVERE